MPKTLTSPLQSQNVSFLVKIEGGDFDKKIEKVAYKKHRSLKKIGYSVLGLRKPNFKTKSITFEKSHKAETCERGVLSDFLIFILLRYFKKIEGGPFGDFEKISKNMRIFNSLIVPKNLKEETFGNFLTFDFLQNIKKNEGRTLWGHLKIFENKSQKAEKGGVSLSKKVRIFCFEKLVKKTSA